jgi:hypothetical protein
VLKSCKGTGRASLRFSSIRKAGCDATLGPRVQRLADTVEIYSDQSWLLVRFAFAPTAALARCNLYRPRIAASNSDSASTLAACSIPKLSTKFDGAVPLEH